MNKFNLGQRGFSAVEALLIIVILAMIGGLGWYVVDANKDKSDETSSSQVSTNYPDVSSSEDLAEAEAYLNETDIDKALDTSEIDAVLE